MSAQEKHVVVVGAGLIGLSTAYHALLRGMKVTVLDRSGEGDPSCSTGNAGMVVPSHFIPLAAPGAISQGLRWMFNPESPFSIRPRPSWELISWCWKFYRASRPHRVKRAMPLLRDLALRSRSRFEELDATADFDFGLQKRGLLMLCKTDKALRHERAIAEQANALGVDAEILDGSGVSAKDPAIEIDVAGGVYFSQDCHLNPLQFLSNLRGAVSRLGGTIRAKSEVAGFRGSGEKIEAVSLTTGEQIDGDEFVLCGGAWTPKTSRQIGLKLPMQAGKGYSVTHPNPPELPTVCSLLNEARVAVTPIGGSLRIGGTMEIVGFDESLNKRKLNGILSNLRNYYPDLEASDFDGLDVWRGLRPCSPDGLPYIGRTQKRDNVIVATGHSMLGLSLSPVTGEIVAQILAGEAPEYDMALLDPDRYSGGRKSISS